MVQLAEVRLWDGLVATVNCGALVVESLVAPGGATDMLVVLFQRLQWLKSPAMMEIDSRC